MISLCSPRAPFARPLESGDLEAVLELSRIHADVMRAAKPPAYDGSFEASLRPYLSSADPQHCLMGGFVDGRLDAYVSVYLWRELPYFSIGNLKTRPGHVNLFSRQPSAFSACAGAALAHAEKHGGYRGYMLHAVSRWPADRVRRSLRRPFPAVDRYHYEIELFVPRYTRPPYPYAWNLMGQRTWSQDLVVEAMTLKQEFRPALGAGVFDIGQPQAMKGERDAISPAADRDRWPKSSVAAGGS